VLGFSPTLTAPLLKQKLSACIARLARKRIVVLPSGKRPLDLYVKRGVGQYNVRLTRGSYFDHQVEGEIATESPLIDPLKAIGFEESSIASLLRQFSHRVLSEWADITLAAKEKHGQRFFKKSAVAYFLDNVREAAKGNRTPPDWWRAMRKEEDRLQRKQSEEAASSLAEQSEQIAFDEYLRGEAREMFTSVTERIFNDLTSHGQDPASARENARHVATMNLRARFRATHKATAGGTTSFAQ
jgi:hypothetical protein